MSGMSLPQRRAEARPTENLRKIFYFVALFKASLKRAAGI